MGTTRVGGGKGMKTGENKRTDGKLNPYCFSTLTQINDDNKQDQPTSHKKSHVMKKPFCC